MNNSDLQDFGNALVTTLEIGDTDKYGNKHPDHEAYLVEMDKQNDKAMVTTEVPF